MQIYNAAEYKRRAENRGGGAGGMRENRSPEYVIGAVAEILSIFTYRVTRC